MLKLVCGIASEEPFAPISSTGMPVLGSYTLKYTFNPISSGFSTVEIILMRIAQVGCCAYATKTGEKMTIKPSKTNKIFL